MSINKIKCVMSAMEYIKLTSKLQFGTQQKLSAEKKKEKKNRASIKQRHALNIWYCQVYPLDFEVSNIVISSCKSLMIYIFLF